MRLRESEEERATVDKVSTWSTLSSFLLSSITGVPQPVTISEASCTGLLDRFDMQWHKGLLSHLGIESKKLPPLCSAHNLYEGDLLPQFTARWPELASASWARGVGDYAAANFGMGCEQQGRVCVSMGANASMRMFVESSPSHKDPLAAIPPELWCYSISKEQYLVGGDLTDGGVRGAAAQGDVPAAAPARARGHVRGVRVWESALQIAALAADAGECARGASHGTALGNARVLHRRGYPCVARRWRRSQSPRPRDDRARRAEEQGSVPDRGWGASDGSCVPAPGGALQKAYCFV
ncbi:hypothetical protein T484DRAFT_1958706, partial [Baffinella frigidus]